MTFSRLLTHASILLGVFAIVSMGIGAVQAVIDGRLPLRGTALSSFGSSQQAVSPASPLQSHIAGEN